MKNKINLKVFALILTTLFVGGAMFAQDGVFSNILVEPVAQLPEDFMKGVDISSLADIEKAGGKFYNHQGQEEDLFKILKDNGVNWVRLRIWNNPVYAEDLKDYDGNVIAKKGTPYGGGNNSVKTDIELAKRAKEHGFKVLLDFHYSDSWADPGKQYTPAAWKKYNAKKLNSQLEKFTKDSIKAFIKAGVRPDMVQVGNELNNGFLWPLGKIWGNDGETVGGMDGFITLLKSAIKGVRSAQGKGDKIKIAVHLANGGDKELYRTIFDAVTEAKVDYDVIGLSFYTYWHGGLSDLRSNMNVLKSRYGKEMVVMETAYAFTPDDGDEQGNVFQVYSTDNAGYKPSVQGQATAVRDVINTVASVQGGMGVFYWEPAWIPVKGAGLSATEGDTWENQAMFDFEGRALPSLAVWNLVSGKGEVKNAFGGSAKNGSNFVPYAMSEPLKITVKPGETPSLPKLMKLLFTNDSENLIFVKWQDYDWANTKKGDSFTLKGIIEGLEFGPEAQITVSSAVNLVEDSSFESGNLGKWVLDGSSTACFVENNKSNAHEGKWTYKYWLGTPFKSSLTQKFTNLQNGKYTLSLWAMGGGGENSIQLTATGFDSADKSNKAFTNIINTGWQVWNKYSIEFEVSSGEVTIGIDLDTNAGNWGNFDDVELFLME